MKSNVTGWRRPSWAALALALIPTGPALADGLPPVADFYAPAQVYRPKLSPDNKFVAASFATANGYKQLGVFELANLQASRTIAAIEGVDVDDYHWVNSERLVFSVGDSEQPGRFLLPGLWAVNRDGSDFRQLIYASYSAEAVNSRVIDRRLSAEWSLLDVVRDGSQDVVVVAPTWDAKGAFVDTKLSRLNTLNGLSTSISVGAPDHAYDWTLDRQGRPAAVTTLDKGRYASYLKTAKGWEQWQEADAYKGSYAEPYWIGPEGELLVTDRRGADTQALFSVDRQSFKPAEQAIVKLKGYDFNGAPIYDAQAGRLLGWRYENDAPGTHWVDADMKALQAEIDQRLPATVNLIDCESCTTAQTVIVTSFSDRQPFIYYLYDRKARSFKILGRARPAIKPEQMGLRDVYRFKARDGMEIPVLVTQPAGKADGPRPAVLLVHGGPWVRGTHWQWEQDAQFLASRGYVVIEPEFRGSTGYGADLHRAGWKQWGLAMQDDLADATRWAAKQGWVDPQRVCIAGASYGGYAALMGLIRDAELYKCGFEWAGVTDINLMYSIEWSDTSAESKRYGMPVLIGDPVADAAQLKATSPLEQAARLKRPLLMGHGGRDRRVPLKHGTAFRDAALQAGAKVEWVEYPEEGHGWSKLASNVDWWTRVEKFLDRNIGAGSR
ncbi:S9 family peptidase [Pelomonas sp. KK5]|uniref:alpha/beta hydrolase family protein n=1 Tax=Pelomonas sp. KK5 TaxID=1855730 RepID=UPI00097BBD8F|nr:prolyl oligopeptidase family serine peptidase [Pelomonas sp. KK5]